MSDILDDYESEMFDRGVITKGIDLARLRELAEAERKGKIKIGSDWTPCADGLPRKETDNVLICYLDKYGFAEVGIGWYWIPNGKWYNDEKGNAIDVLAWQPLPKPYNPDRKEDAKDGE